MNDSKTDVLDGEQIAGGALSNVLAQLNESESGGRASDARLVDQIVEAPAEGEEDDLDQIVADILAEDGEEEEGGLEDVMGRNENDAENGKWVPVTEMGEPGDLVRRLNIASKLAGTIDELTGKQAVAMLKIAKVPNKQFNRLIDLLKRKWQARHRDELPLEKVREALPAIYARSVLKGMRFIFLRKTDAQPLTDNFDVRSAMLRKYNPELLDAVDKFGRELKNFQDKPAAERGGAVPNS